MTTKVTVPCHKCVLIAICRNKLFDDMIKDCKLMLDSLYFDKTTSDGARSLDFGEKAVMVQDILNPEYWSIEIKDDFAHIISDKTDYVTSISRVPSHMKTKVPKGFRFRRKSRAKGHQALQQKIRERKLSV